MEQIGAFLSKISLPSSCHLHIITDKANLMKYIPPSFEIHVPFTIYKIVETNYSSFYKDRYSDLIFQEPRKIRPNRIKIFNCLLTIVILSPFQDTNPFKIVTTLSTRFRYKLSLAVSSSKLFLEPLSDSILSHVSKQFQDYMLIWITNWYPPKSKLFPVHEFFLAHWKMREIGRFSHCPVFLVNIRYYVKKSKSSSPRPKIVFVCNQCSRRVSRKLKLIRIGIVENSGELFLNFEKGIKKCEQNLMDCLKLGIMKSIKFDVILMPLKPYNLCKARAKLTH
ncbi:hypothetical protein Fcan01_24998 [Folsomia candida]|uniref:Uncharacterized protein n=1 Tax=Folsomia candida TaxID=158441 RepID=A0A226D5K3_FOLCA|nr:hypothetical protein Fcan01_24998 [Folsomia candida]